MKTDGTCPTFQNKPYIVLFLCWPSGVLFLTSDNMEHNDINLKHWKKVFLVVLLMSLEKDQKQTIALKDTKKLDKTKTLFSLSLPH